LVQTAWQRLKADATLSFSNDAQYLVVNKASISWFRLDIDAYQFRPNLVVDAVDPFVENHWKGLDLHVPSSDADADGTHI